MILTTPCLQRRQRRSSRRFFFKSPFKIREVNTGSKLIEAHRLVAHTIVRPGTGKRLTNAIRDGIFHRDYTQRAVSKPDDDETLTIGGPSMS